MATYLILNLAVLCVICVTLLRHIRWNRLLTALIIVLIITTAVFDSLLIMCNFFAYNPAKILGISIGMAPIEDFAYAIAAVIMVPALWNKKRGDT